MKNVFIYTDGCELRLIDAKKISNYLSLNKYQIIDNPDRADIIIYITCAFLERATEISLNKIKEFQKYNAELIVAGCLSAIDKEELRKIFDGKTITTKDIDDIDKLFQDNKIKFCDIDDANLLYANIDERTLVGVLKKLIRKSKRLENIAIKIKEIFLKYFFGTTSLILDSYYISTSQKSLFHIRISGGCLGSCTYCAIKKAIGEHKSKPIETCLKEFKKGLSNGYKNFILEADDSGAYGLDIGSDLPELLNKITSIPGEYSVAIRNLHPRWVVKYIDDLEKILSTGKIDSIDVPIQTSSSRILKLMNRYSNTVKIKDVILRLKQSYPGIKINTCYILGFPTETDEEFRETLDFIKKLNMGGYVFRFSCKKGSKAENIEPKIPEEEISKRMKFAKKFLKHTGYTAISTRRTHFLIFEKKQQCNFH